jgi:hypothetical protein
MMKGILIIMAKKQRTSNKGSSTSGTKKYSPNISSKWVSFLVEDPNFSPETNHPGWGSSRFSSVNTDKCWYSKSDLVETTSFNIFYNSSLINHSTVTIWTAYVVHWSEFLAIDPEVRVRFPALPEFLRSSGSGTGYNWGATWKKSQKSQQLRSRKSRLRL